ncbi:MAG: ROK family protein [Peptostreptococcaceae bacterium]
MYTIGIDVGGMSIKAGVVKEGEIIHRAVKETDAQGGLDKLVADITALVNEITSENNIAIEEVKTIGIGFPGVVTNQGAVTCVNLGLNNALIVPKLNENFKNVKVEVGNDANVAALAEYAYGSMKGYDTGVMITLGTGVGGGIVVNGKLMAGANGVGAEIGHMMLATNYFDCNCGNNGCFETFCSATAIIKYAQKLLEENRETKVREMCENDINKVTAKMVFDAYRENDEVAVEVINRFKKYLAMGIANIVNFMDPAVISIGGGVSNASDIVLEGLTENVKQYLPFKETAIGDIVIAQFKNDAGILGASAL